MKEIINLLFFFLQGRYTVLQYEVGPHLPKHTTHSQHTIPIADKALQH